MVQIKVKFISIVFALLSLTAFAQTPSEISKIISASQQDLFIPGQSGQSALNNNIMLAVAGVGPVNAVASTGVTYRSFYCQVVGSSGISAGQIIFEGSSDNVNWLPILVYDETGTSTQSAISIAANAKKQFSGKLGYNYIRARISTGFTGGTVTATTKLSLTDYAIPVAGSGGGGGGNVTVTNFPSSQTVNGTVSVSNLPSTQTVSGTVAVSNFPSSQTVNGSVSVLGGNATAVKVDGSGVTQPISGSVSVSNLPSTQNVNVTNSSIPVTGTFYQATQPISGSVSVSNFPGTQTVSGTVTTTPSGTQNTNITQVGGSSLALGQTTMAGSVPVTISSNQSSIPVTGTFWQSTQPVSLASLPALSAGSNTIGNVNVLGGNATAVKVDGSAVTQPISGTVTVNPLPAGSNTIGNVNVLGGNATAVKVDGSAVTQPISGTVTVNALTNSSVVKAQLQDNSGNALNSTSNALNVNVQNSSIPVTGTFYQATQPVSLSSTVPDVTGSGTINTQNLNATGAATTNSSVTLTGLNGQATAIFQISANTLSGPLTFQASLDGTTWTTYFGTQSIANGYQVSTVGAGLTGTWEVNCAGVSQVRLVALGAVTGSATVVGRASLATGQTVGADIESFGGVPIALGSTTSSASLPVNLASDQIIAPVTTAVANVVNNPSTLSIAVLNGTVQWTVQNGGGYYITLTNAPAVTANWSGTITFQYSLNNSTWNSLNVVSLGGQSAQTSTSAANGIWYVPPTAFTGTTSQLIYIRCNMTAYTSGTVYCFLAPADKPNTKVILPWNYTVTSGQTVMPVMDASSFNELSIQITAVTTTVLTAQGTNDPTLTNWQSLPVIGQASAAITTLTMTTNATYRINTQSFKYVRIQCTTTGTVLTIQGVSGTQGPSMVLNSYGNDIGIGYGTINTVSTVSTAVSYTHLTLPTILRV